MLSISAVIAYYLLVKINNDKYVQVISRSVIAVPLLVGSLLISIICYYKQLSYVKKNYSEEYLRSFNIKLNKITLYPIIVVVLYFPGVLYEAFGVGGDFFTFVVAIFYVSGGFVNTIVYFYVRKV